MQSRLPVLLYYTPVKRKGGRGRKRERKAKPGGDGGAKKKDERRRDGEREREREKPNDACYNLKLDMRRKGEKKRHNQLIAKVEKPGPKDRYSDKTKQKIESLTSVHRIRSSACVGSKKIKQLCYGLLYAHLVLMIHASDDTASP